MREFSVTELRLGDRAAMVTSGGGFAYSRFTVYEITPDEVICIRPYVHCSDTTYIVGNSKKVITYLGWEKMVFHKDTDIRFWVFEHDDKGD